MHNGFKKIIFISTFSILILCPITSFAWHDYASYGDWNYHGSGRDHPYSDYIDQYYYIGPADYAPIPAVYLNQPLTIRPILSAPIVVVAAKPDEFPVNIPDHNGGFITVVIKRSGDGFLGPKGEYYPEFPKVFQLEMKYGR